MQFSRKISSFVVAQCVLLTSHQHTNGSQFFFVLQTPVVVHADLMSFVFNSDSCKVTRKTTGLPSTSNSCAWWKHTNWSAIVIYRRHHKE